MTQDLGFGGVSQGGGELILVALKDKRGILSHILTLVPSDWNIRRSTRDQRMGKGTLNRIHGKETMHKMGSFSGGWSRKIMK